MRKIILMAGAAMLMAAPAFAHDYTSAGSTASSSASIAGVSDSFEKSGAYNTGYSETTSSETKGSGVSTQTTSADKGGVYAFGWGDAGASEGGHATTGLTTY